MPILQQHLRAKSSAACAFEKLKTYVAQDFLTKQTLVRATSAQKSMLGIGFFVPVAGSRKASFSFSKVKSINARVYDNLARHLSSHAQRPSSTCAQSILTSNSWPKSPPGLFVQKSEMWHILVFFSAYHLSCLRAHVRHSNMPAAV